MKSFKNVIALSLLFVLLCSAVAFAQKMPFYGKVTASRLNVREYPNTNAEIFGQVVKGDEVLVSEMRNTSNGQWYYVMVSGELEGWVLGKYVQYKRPANF